MPIVSYQEKNQQRQYIISPTTYARLIKKKLFYHSTMTKKATFFIALPVLTRSIGRREIELE